MSDMVDLLTDFTMSPSRRVTPGFKEMDSDSESMIVLIARATKRDCEKGKI